jgi:hypothetical protein
LVAEGPGQIEGFFHERRALGSVTLPPKDEHAQPPERSHTIDRRPRRVRGQGALEPHPSFVFITLPPPERPQIRSKPEQFLAIRDERPLQRGAHVVALGVHPVEPGLLAPSPQFLGGASRQGTEIRGVGPPGRCCLTRRC